MQGLDQPAPDLPPTPPPPSLLPMPLASGGTLPPPPIAQAPSQSSSTPTTSGHSKSKKKGLHHSHSSSRPPKTTGYSKSKPDDEAYGEEEDAGSDADEDQDEDGEDSSFSDDEDQDDEDEEYEEGTGAGSGYSRSRARAAARQQQYAAYGAPGMMQQPFYGAAGIAPVRLGGPSMPHGTVANGNVAVSYVQYVGADGRPYFIPRFQTMAPRGPDGMPVMQGTNPAGMNPMGMPPMGMNPMNSMNPMGMSPMGANPMPMTSPNYSGISPNPNAAPNPNPNANPIPSPTNPNPNPNQPLPSPSNPTPLNSAPPMPSPQAPPQPAPQSPQLMRILNDIAGLAPEKQAEVINQIVSQHALSNSLSPEQAQSTRAALQKLVNERTALRMQQSQQMFYSHPLHQQQQQFPFYAPNAPMLMPQRPQNAAFFAAPPPPRNFYQKQPQPQRKEPAESSTASLGPRPKRAATKNVKYKFDEEEEALSSSSSSASDTEEQPQEPKKESQKKKASEKDSSSQLLPQEEDNIDKILSYRRTTEGEEFLVKYHGKSYIHTEWVPRSRIAGTPMGSTRIKRFMPKYQAAQQQKPFPPPAFPPRYTFVERIIGEWTSDEGVVFYLTKWGDLSHEFVTWETLQDLNTKAQNAQPALEEFCASKLPSVMKQTPFIRPSPAAWASLPASPTYKDGHELRKYQLEGLNWLTYCWFNRQSCIIADEMGLGKTIQTVSFLDLLYNKFKLPGPFLVVVPLSTIPHWEREFHGWTSLRTITYHGSAPSRDVMFEYEFFYRDAKGAPINGLFKFDVLITTYEMANSPSGAMHLKGIPWRVGIFDEAHRLKNKASKSAEVLSSFRIEHKVLATGTPIQNSLDELFALLNFMEPSRFSDAEAFASQYGRLKGGEDVERLQKLLRPIMLRRLKEDVEKSIPVKEETIIEVELTSIQKRLYRAILEKNIAYLTKGGKGTNVGNLMNTMMELRKCCIHPYLIKGAEEQIVLDAKAVSIEEQYNLMINACGKLVLLDKLLKKLREGDHKVLIFSQMTKCLDLLEDYLKYRQHPFERIDGTIRGDLRQAAIDRFSLGGPESFVFLLCTRAGGVGINLTSADTVVIFDSDWNPQNDLQAQARCHRIGQKKSVKVYRLITRGTYEREMFDRAGMKLGLDKAVLQSMEAIDRGTGEEEASNTPASLSDKKQVETLLKKGAYGVLMDNDEDALQFCAEDIDQILERRTTVVRHEGDNGTAGAADNGTSIFSKASFSLQDTDNNVDLDDPNFWENWAKKLCVDSGTLQQTLAVDEPRMKRHYKRIKACDYLEALGEENGEKEESSPSETAHLALGTAQRRMLLKDFLLFGINNQSEQSASSDLTQNEVLAYAKALVRFCLDAVHPADTDAKFKVDTEKTLLGAIPSSIQTTLANAEEDPALSKLTFSKDEIPFPNATKAQCYKYTTWLKSCNDKGLIEWIQKNAYCILIRLLILEFLRQITEYYGKAHLQAGKEGAFFQSGQGYQSIDKDNEYAFKKALISLHKRFQTETKLQAQMSSSGGTAFTPGAFKRRRTTLEETKAAIAGGRPSLSCSPNVPGSDSGPWEQFEFKEAFEQQVQRYGLPSTVPRDWTLWKQGDSQLSTLDDQVLDSICSSFLLAAKEKNLEQGSTPPQIPTARASAMDEDDDEEGEGTGDAQSLPSNSLTLAVQLFDILRLDILPKSALLTGEAPVRVRKAQGMPRWWDPVRHDAELVNALTLHGWNPDSISKDEAFRAAFKRKRLPDLGFVARRIEAVAEGLAKASVKNAVGALSDYAVNEISNEPKRPRRATRGVERGDDDDEDFEEREEPEEREDREEEFDTSNEDEGEDGQGLALPVRLRVYADGVIEVVEQ